jgi:Peptidase propeptide and YPEB domain
VKRSTKLIAGGALAVALIGAGAGMAVAGSNDESNDGGALSGSTRDRAVAAALEATGGGRVSEAENADDGGTYSVEVIVEGGRHIEVKLDGKFHVIDQATDDDGNGDDGADGG